MKTIDNVRILVPSRLFLKRFLIYWLVVATLFGTVLGLMLWLGPYEFTVNLIFFTVTLSVFSLSLPFYSWILLKTDSLLLGASMLIFFALLLLGLYEFWSDIFKHPTPENEVTQMHLVSVIKVLGLVFPVIMLAIAANVITKSIHPKEGNKEK